MKLSTLIYNLGEFHSAYGNIDVVLWDGESMCPIGVSAATDPEKQQVVALVIESAK